MSLQAKILDQQGSIKRTLVILIATTIVLLYSAFQISRNHQFQFFGKIISHVETDKKVVALTFDDGPTYKGTEPVIEILRQHEIKATFYLNGRPMQQHPELATLLIDAGHEIGNHSYSHKRMVFMPYSDVAEELESTSKLIRELGYQGEIRFRPPYGKKLFMLPYYLANNDITTATWDVEAETFHQGEDTPELIVKRTMKSVKPGSIILLHVMHGDGSTLKALPEIISRLKQRGYRFATVSELIELSPKSLVKG